MATAYVVTFNDDSIVHVSLSKEAAERYVDKVTTNKELFEITPYDIDESVIDNELVYSVLFFNFDDGTSCVDVLSTTECKPNQITIGSNHVCISVYAYSVEEARKKAQVIYDDYLENPEKFPNTQFEYVRTFDYITGEKIEEK